MARKNASLTNRLRSTGLRKRTAKLVSDTVSAGSKRTRGAEKRTMDVIGELRKLADDVEKQIRKTGPGKSKNQRRSEAAKKAARTRARNAAARSRAAQKGAKTRAKSKRGR